MKKIGILLMVVTLVLFGCEKSSNNTVVECTLETDVLNATYEYEADGDNLIKIKNVQKSDYKSLGYSEEEASELLESYANMIDGEGVTYSFEIKDDKMVETLEIDLSIADLRYMSELGYINTAEGSDVVSLEESINSIKDLGASCTEEE